MKKTIDLTKQALDIYNEWGYQKSEKVSKAIVEFENKTSIETKIEDLERRVKALEK